VNAQLVYRGRASADFSGDSVTMNLPDGRSVVLPMEVREDGIYVLIDKAAQAVIDDAVRVAPERQEAVLSYAFTSPSMEPPPRMFRSAATGRRATGKRAQRKMNKP